MALQVTLVFICAGLSAIQSISTVGHVTAEVGQTVHIPCKYESKYKDNVKYLCRRSDWGSCTYEIKTDRSHSTKYSIHDDKTHGIVTFTFHSLQLKNSDYYWCAVDRPGTDDGKLFQLSVTNKGQSKLYVDSQQVAGHFDQTTVYCKSRGCGQILWCRLGGSCVSDYGRTDGAYVSTNRSVPGLFSVTMTELEPRNTGWYWCSCGVLQMPVFLTLSERPTTTTVATTTTLATTTETTIPAISPNEPDKKRVSDYVIAAVIALCVLVLIVVTSLVICSRLQRNRKKTEDDLLYSERADDPIYSNISKGPTSHQNPCTAKEMEIFYSSVRFISNGAPKKVKAREEDVVYSTLAQH